MLTATNLLHLALFCHFIAGAYDVNSLATLHTLAELVKMEDLREGVALLEECQRGYVASLGAHHRVSLGVMLSLSDAYVVMGRHEEALTMLQAVHKHFQRTLGLEHPDTFSAGEKLAAACAASGITKKAAFLPFQHLSSNKEYVSSFSSKHFFHPSFHPFLDA